MPVLKIETNAPAADGAGTALLQAASRLVADALGKPERYVMVSLQANPRMLFAGDDAPLAYLELKSIGLPESRTAELSAILCKFMDEQLGVTADRVYIEFADAPRAMFGWNGGTF